MSSIKPEQLNQTIMKELESYQKFTVDEVKRIVKDTADAVVENIKSNAPVDTGAYRKSFEAKKTHETNDSLEMTVHSTNRYRLTHLLENGHATRNGGRTKAQPHFAQAEKLAEEKLTQAVERRLS